MARTDCVCSGAQRAPSRGDSTAAGHWCTAALPDVSLRGPEVAVAISQCPVESLESLRRKRKPFHRDSFCQNIFDISGKGGYNKDVDGSLFTISEPVDDLANQPEDRKYPEQVLKCYMYHLLRDISRRGYTCLPPFRSCGMTGNRL